jgi:hypothetical protein
VILVGLKFAFIAQTTLMRKFLALFAGFFTVLVSEAQLQVGIFGGIANYQGDLVDKLYQQPKAAFGLTMGYQVTSRVNLRASLIFAKVAGADSLNTKQENLRLRNLSFESPVTEFSVIGELNSFDLDIKNWSPYIFAGLAVYHFNPYTMDQNGNKVFLQALSTEGQGLPGYSPSKPYPLTQLAIPFGGGIKYNIKENIRIALEVGLRKLFSDYLDDASGNYADPADLLAARGQRAVDFSYRGDEIAGGNPGYPAKGTQRGSPKYKDYYYFTGLHLTFLLPEGNRGNGAGARAAKKGGYGCPTVF